MVSIIFKNNIINLRRGCRGTRLASVLCVVLDVAPTNVFSHLIRSI